MYAWIPKIVPTLGTISPYLWGFAAAAAVDYVIDVQSLLPAVLAAATMASVGTVIVRSQRP
jgi:hypothetical protein